MQGIDYAKISITAKLVAHFRQYSDIPFAEDVASFVKAEAAVQAIAAKLKADEKTPEQQKEMVKESNWSAPLLEARYKSIVELIQQTGIKQVLELASGFSLRGLAMASQDAEFNYVETDLADINEEKKKLVTLLRTKHGLSDLGNHHIITANALDRGELEAATAPLKRDQPLAIVNEGLIPYLSTTEQESLADNVHYLLGKFNGGAWITPDFATRDVADAVSEHRKRFREAINSTTERQLHGAAFASEEALNEFIRNHGFSGTSQWQIDVVPTLVSPERLGISDEVVKRLKPQMRIWLLRETSPA